MTYKNQLFISNYLYSPKTKYHNIPVQIKVIYIFLTLFFLPYFNSYQIITFISLLILIIEINIVYKLIYMFYFNKVKFLTILLNYIVFISRMKSNRITYNNQIRFCQLTIPYFIKWHNYSVKTTKVIVMYYFILLSIPSWIFKLISVFVLSSHILHILYFCTKYETILEIIINALNRTKQKINLFHNKYIINLFLGYIFLEEFKLCLKNINLSIKIKKINITSIKTDNLNILLKKYTIFFPSNHNDHSIILWNREIKYQDFSNFQIYY
uniref:Uncharacterized protein n=1 Tax=Osmundea sinicola TaxID=290685 RepID=A0A7L4WNM8_9FLOR|nr:hypothetical protein [Osmundea sinicola]QFR99873.1 hypothetical protein [Osmundea sinicola]